MKRVTFVVADPSYLIRRGLVSTIEEIGNTSVLREVDDCERIVKAVVDLRPDYLIFNPSLLPTGAVSLRCLFGQSCETRFVALLSGNHDFEYASQVSCIVHLHDGKSSIIQIVKGMIGIHYKEMDVELPIGELTPKELMIVRDVSLGLPNKEIADKNFISIHTVITHRKNITRKLGIKSASGLTVYAILNKLIDIEDVP